MTAKNIFLPFISEYGYPRFCVLTFLCVKCDLSCRRVRPSGVVVSSLPFSAALAATQSGPVAIGGGADSGQVPWLADGGRRAGRGQTV